MSAVHVDPARSQVSDLRQVSAPRLLFALLSQRFNGTVKIEQAEPQSGSRVLRSVSGMPVQFDWVSDGTRLGELLVTAEVLPQSALGVALRDTSPERPLGRVLQEKGLVDSNTIKRTLREQTERRLLALFALRSGRIEFSPGPAEPQATGGDLAAVNTLALIGRGVLEHYDVPRVLEEAPGLETGEIGPGPSLEKYRTRFELGPRGDALIAALLEKSGKVDDIAGRAKVDRGFALKVLYVLWACQMVSVDAPLRASDLPDLSRRATALAELLRQGAQPHAVLGLDEAADLDRIDAVARDLARLFDLEALPPNFPAATREKVRQVSEALPGIVASAREQRLVSVEFSSKRLLKEAKWSKALPLVEELASVKKGDPSLRAWLAWCRYQTSRRLERDAKLCLDALTRIVESDDSLSHAHYCRAMVLEDLGRNPQAISAFERAVALDASLLDAERHLRALKAGTPVSSSSVARSEVSAPKFTASFGKRSDRHPLMSGAWRRIWIVVGVLFGMLLMAQIVLRLDF